MGDLHGVEVQENAMRRYRIVSDVWSLLLRVVMGLYWLYFSSQKWFDYSWVRGLLQEAARNNYLPVYGDILRLVAESSWAALTIVLTIVEALIGVALLLGVFIRVASAVGALIDANLLLTFSFCDCPWNTTEFPLVFWFYFAPMLLNAQIALTSEYRLTLITALRKLTS